MQINSLAKRLLRVLRKSKSRGIIVKPLSLIQEITRQFRNKIKVGNLPTTLMKLKVDFKTKFSDSPVQISNEETKKEITPGLTH
jgi:hypothetical protein